MSERKPYVPKGPAPVLPRSRADIDKFAEAAGIGAVNDSSFQSQESGVVRMPDDDAVVAKPLETAPLDTPTENPISGAAARKIYAEVEFRRRNKGVTFDENNPEHVKQQEELGKQWDQMESTGRGDALAWQKSVGAKAIAQHRAFQTYTVDSAANVANKKSTVRSHTAEIALGDADRVAHFKATGQVLGNDGEPVRDWNKGWVANLTSSPEIAAQKGAYAGKQEGAALHTDSQFHAKLGNHIESLVGRAQQSGTNPNIHNGQFGGITDRLANEAREALTGSAMAHSLGMKDLAVSHFQRAKVAADNLANHVNGSNVAATHEDNFTSENAFAGYKHSVTPQPTLGSFQQNVRTRGARL